MAHDLGQTVNLDLAVTPFDETTEATVEVTSPSGVDSSPAATSGDAGHTWVAQVTLDEPGDWIAKWTVAGVGQNVKYQTIPVDPVPPQTEAQNDVRLLISDTDPANRFFSTREIASFLRLNSDNVRRAAAQALETIAGNEALVSKKIRTQDLSTDGPAVAKELRELAKSLRAQADQGDGDEEAGSGFEIVEFEPHPYRPERAWY